MRSLKIDDFSKIVHVADPQLSPDGKKLALVTVRPNLKENKYNYEILLYDVETGDTLYSISSEEGDQSPRWSPSGKKIVFTSRRGFKEEEKGNAIFLSVLAGEPRLIAKKREGFSQVRFLNESELIAISPTPVRKVDEDGDYVEIWDIPPWFDGSGFIDEYRRQIYLIDVESGLYKQLTSSENDIVYAAPSNSGEKIAYVRKVNKKKPLITEVRIYNVKKGEDFQIVEPKYSFISVEWSPDDKHLVLHGSDMKRGLVSHNHIWVTSSATPSDPVNLTGKLDRNTRPAISCDMLGPYRVYSPPQWRGEHIYFLVNEEGRSNLYRVNLSGEIECILKGEFAIYNFSIAKKSNRIALLKVDAKTPPEIYLYENGGIRKFTHFNDWLSKEVKFSELHHMKVKVSDGAEVDAWYLEPIDKEEDKKYPVVVFIHGGPKAAYGPVLNFMHQLMAANGYYVLFSNPRGSDGYSEEFADIRRHYGERDYRDIMEVVEAFLKKVSSADTERLGVTGISYGGFMTNWIVTQTDRFKAAVSENGIADWIADFWASDIGYWFDPDQIGDTPMDNIEGYIRQSPVYYAKNVKTPILLIHSMEDYRCFIDQSTAFHIALKLYDKESRLIIFKKGSHGHSIRAKPRHRKKRYELILNYFNEKLENPAKRR
ncbi:MAG: S9 family peptidase [Candidatus Methanomethylicota archaeon]|uniref:S9 family peptidase n=1 Tax=Thermoproteota archaeon TaxID=2056631 RepID=A0A497EXP3_9CREN|nr:MAG: S9 family peptidase [Candidatus Verstraetearchaeota archaeon]